MSWRLIGAWPERRMQRWSTATPPAQRSGVLASLNMAADTLGSPKPMERETTSRWSAAGWSVQDRTAGCSSPAHPETRPRLVPLTSLWLDTLVLRLMNRAGRDMQRPT